MSTTNTRGAHDEFADGVVWFSNSQGTSSRGTLVHAGRSQVVFEVYNPYSIVQLSEVLSELRLHRRGRVIYQGRAMVSSLMTTGLMTMVSAALVDPWSDLDNLITRDAAREEAARFLKDWEQTTLVEPGFRLAVGRLKGFLADLSRWLDGAELTMDGSPPPRGETPPPLGRDIVEEIEETISDPLSSVLHGFETAAGDIEPESMTLHRSYAQRELHPYTLVCPWVHRCYDKPFGYAGDYVMLNMTLTDHFVGPNSYASILNRSILKTAPPIAYGNRIGMLVDRLTREFGLSKKAGHSRFSAMTIGCGPVNEVQALMRQHKECAGSHFHLMDFNQQTIDFATQRVAEVHRETGVELDIVTTNKSIHELLLEARGRKQSDIGPYDMVYCAGLFDYLSDRVCASLIELFYQWVHPGGLVIVTNVKHSEPIQNSLELLMEWYLIYRDENRMLSLIPKLGEQTVTTDATGINMFLEIRKPRDPG